MLKLQNVCKTYVTKSKVGTVALQDVNLEIADCGMVFILGKSGSGKSTLLNLLGGLDNPTSGEIFVAGVSMQKFSPRDYANYRNNYVGFVFQEYNLLADFNVRDNVALALKLTKANNEDAKVSEALKQVELNDTYLSRRIGEMSGGEKQRIAIARALIKDSKLILADEPTGNLDSATSESIWNILKNLSKERLVVVVSHDRESAEKYADRTIEIADGKIISDVGAQPVTPAEVAKDSTAKETTEQADSKKSSSPRRAKTGMSFATRIKMAWRNLRLRKFRTASVILIAVFCILSLLITQMELCYSADVALAHYIKQNRVDYFQVEQGSVDSAGEFTRSYNAYSPDTMKFVSNKSDFIFDGIVKSKQEILDFGLTFVGDALELDDNSFYTTLKELNDTSSVKVKVDGEYVPFESALYPWTFLVGKYVIISWPDDSRYAEECVLAGIIDTEKVSNPDALPRYFYNENFIGFLRGKSGTGFNADGKTHVLQLGNKNYDEQFIIGCKLYSISSPGSVITADGTLVDGNEIRLDDDEIVLTFELYRNLFSTAQNITYYLNNGQVINIPEGVGKTVSLKLIDYDTGELISDLGEKKIVGVNFGGSYARYIYTNDNISLRLCRDMGWCVSSSPIVIRTSTVINLVGFARTLRNRYNGYLEGTGRNSVDIAVDVENNVSFSFVVFLSIGVVLLVVLVLLVINLISVSIAGRKKEIGILSALGASNGDIISIFLLETLIISAIVFVIVFALSFAFAAVYNVVYSQSISDLYYTFPFLNVDVLTVAISAVSSFGLLLLAALIPLRKIIKLKPIDAIRNN